MVGWRILLWAVLVVAALAFLYLVRGVLLPFILSFVIAALLDPSIRRLRLKGWPRPLAVLFVFSIFLMLTLGLGVWLTPIVGGQLATLRTKFEGVTASLGNNSPNDNFFVRWNPVVQAEQAQNENEFDRLLDKYRPQLEQLHLPSTRKSIVDQYIEPHKGDIGAAVQGFFSGFLGLASNLASKLLFMLLVPFITLMILLDFDQLKRRSATWIPPAIRASTLAIMDDIGQVFIRYLRGVTITVLTYMVVMATLLTILGAPYSILLGILFGTIYLIPYLGPIINCLVLFTVVGLSDRTGNFFLHFDSPWVYAFVVTLVYLILGFIFDQLVYPRLVGRSVGLHPVVSMFVIFSGGALFGLMGMIIAFPLAGSIKVILDRLLKVTSKSPDALSLPSVPLRHRRATT